MQRRQSVSNATTAFIQFMHEQLGRLHEIWDEVGMDDRMRGDRVLSVFAHLRSLLEQMEDEESKMLKNIHNSVIEMRREVQKIRRELEMGEFSDYPDLELLELQELLKKELNQLNNVKMERTNKLALLIDNDSKLCSLLEIRSFPNLIDKVPSESDIDELQSRIAKNEQLVEERNDKFGEMGEEIGRLLKQMDENPPNEFCANLIEMKNDRETLNLSTANLHAAKFLLKTTRGNFDKFVANYRSRFDSLYNLLTIWWDKCHVSEKEKTNIPTFNVDDISESILAKIETEITRWQSYFSKNHEVFQLIEKWTQLWAEKVDAEQGEKNPGRYTNRGGNLAAQLKRVKDLDSLLSKSRANLSNVVEGDSFKNSVLIQGLNPVAFIDQIVQNHEKNRQLERIQKTSAKKQQLKQESRFGSTPVKKGLPSPMKKTNLNPDACTNLTNKMLASRARSPAQPIRTALGTTKRRMTPSPNRAKMQANSDKVDTVANYTAFARGIHGKPPCSDADSVAHSSFADSNGGKKPPIPPNRR